MTLLWPRPWDSYINVIPICSQGGNQPRWKGCPSSTVSASWMLRLMASATARLVRESKSSMNGCLLIDCWNCWAQDAAKTAVPAVLETSEEHAQARQLGPPPTKSQRPAVAVVQGCEYRASSKMSCSPGPMWRLMPMVRSSRKLRKESVEFPAGYCTSNTCNRPRKWRQQGLPALNQERFRKVVQLVLQGLERVLG